LCGRKRNAHNESQKKNEKAGFCHVFFMQGGYLRFFVFEKTALKLGPVRAFQRVMTI
jgi:hypothetical protein